MQAKQELNPRNWAFEPGSVARAIAYLQYQGAETAVCGDYLARLKTGHRA